MADGPGCPGRCCPGRPCHPGRRRPGWSSRASGASGSVIWNVAPRPARSARDGAAVRGHQRGHDRQAQAGAAGRRGSWPGRRGRTARRRAAPGRGACPVPSLDVEHDGGRPWSSGPGAILTRDRGVPRGVRERVVHQVADYLPQPGSSPSTRNAAPGATVEVDRPVGGDHPGVLHRVGGQGEQVDRRDVSGRCWSSRASISRSSTSRPIRDASCLDPPHDPVEVGRGELAVAAAVPDRRGWSRPAEPSRDPCCCSLRTPRRPLPVVLGEAADRGQRGAQLVAGVGDEPAHPLLGARARPARTRSWACEGGLDLGEHRVQRAAELPTSVRGSRVGHAVVQVPGRDGPRGQLDVVERAQVGLRRPRRRRWPGHHDDRADQQVDTG